MSTLPYAVFDADNHYYEALDAFTRHIDPKLARRAVQWAEINGKPRLIVAGKLNRFIPNPTFDPVARPGCLDDFFRGRNPEGADIRKAFGELEPLNPAYRKRDDRLALMDRQGVDGCLLFPTLGVGLEEAMQHDPEVLHGAFHAFNQWLDEDWGFHYRERLYAAPYISLVDPERAAQEVEWALERDARVVVLRSGPVRCPDGYRSPADPRMDPFWARVNEAGITVCFHSGDSGYKRYLADWGEGGDMRSFGMTPFAVVTTSSRPMLDTAAALVCHGLFRRHPRLRVASIENGGNWALELLSKLEKVGGQFPWAFHEHPLETFRKHFWIAPFYEEDARALADAIGADHVLLGSDFPHAEGLAEPLAYVDELGGFSDDEVRHVMRDNGRSLVEPGWSA